MLVLIILSLSAMVYDDAAPRCLVEPKDVRSYLDERLVATVNQLAHEQGGKIPLLREIRELHPCSLCSTHYQLWTTEPLGFQIKDLVLKRKPSS